MVQIEPFIVVLIVAAIVAVMVKYVRFPYMIALVLAGMAIGFVGIQSLQIPLLRLRSRWMCGASRRLAGRYSPLPCLA
jgi:hypothetical protein